MKILYAIQGTGNGHLARATEMVPHLQKLAKTDVLVSGIQGDLKLPFQVDYQFFGLSFIFGKKGGVSISKTLLRMNIIRLIKDIINLPVHEYDLVISDFEPVTTWACKLRKKKCIGLSHQNAVLHSLAPKPVTDNWLGHFILKNYAPASHQYGFHFQSLDSSVFTPVIRPSIRKAIPLTNGHFTVYLPAYSDDEIHSRLHKFSHIKWEVFSKYCTRPYANGNIHFRPVSLEGFTQSFTTCSGIICTAGFETPAEAIFMGKKLAVIPMKKQFEQTCNAAFLKQMGITVFSGLKNQESAIRTWLESDQKLHIKYPDDTAEVLRRIVFSA